MFINSSRLTPGILKIGVIPRWQDRITRWSTALEHLAGDVNEDQSRFVYQ